MKRALDYREYRDTKPFKAPAGIVSMTIDPESGMPADPGLPEDAHRSLHRRHRASRRLPAARRTRRRHHELRLGHHVRRPPPPRPEAVAAPVITGSRG